MTSVCTSVARGVERGGLGASQALQWLRMLFEAEAVSVTWYSQCLGLVNPVFVGVGGNGFVKVLCVLSQWCIFFLLSLSSL